MTNSFTHHRSSMRRGHPVSQLKTSVLSPAHLSGSRQRGKPQVQLRDNVCFCTTPETHTHIHTHTHIMQLLSTRKGKPQQREMPIPTLRAITLLVCVLCTLTVTCCKHAVIYADYRVCVCGCVYVYSESRAGFLVPVEPRLKYLHIIFSNGPPVPP